MLLNNEIIDSWITANTENLTKIKTGKSEEIVGSIPTQDNFLVVKIGKHASETFIIDKTDLSLSG